MKKIFILLLTLFVVPVFGQTFEEKAADKSCECLKQKSLETELISKEDFTNCVKSSTDQVLKEMGEKEAKKKMKNMMGFVNSIKSIQAMTINNCGLKPKEENIESK